MADSVFGADLSPAALGRLARRRLSLLVTVLIAARGTTTWLAIVSATQLVLAHASTRLDTALLLSTSTNLHNLRSDPLNVLVTSACIVPSRGDYVEFLIECVIFLAPLEYMIGTVRWLIGLIVGHVGATLIVAVALSTSMLHTDLPPGRVIDVGVSYAMTCLLVVLAYRLHGLRRWGLAIFVTVFVISGLLMDGGFSDWGHFVSAGLGLAIAPLLVPKRPQTGVAGSESVASVKAAAKAG